MRSAVIFDVDGTVTNSNHRQYVLKETPIDWKRYFYLGAEDAPKLTIIRVLEMYNHMGYAVIMLTGRPELYRYQTEVWLKQYEVPFDVLFMRGNDDHRKNHEFKQECYQKMIRHRFNVVAAYDDSDYVCQMWRQEGVQCLQVY